MNMCITMCDLYVPVATARALQHGDAAAAQLASRHVVIASAVWTSLARI